MFPHIKKRRTFNVDMYFILITYFTLLIFHLSESSHFRGGTISWKPIKDHTIEFKFKMGWTFGSGPGCSNSKIGQFVNTSFIGDKVWKCTSGCDLMKMKDVGTVFYYCTAASTVGTDVEKWEQGENSFQQVFVGDGPFTISYVGAMWMTLDFGNPNGWNLQTTVDLRSRDDTNSTNSSPITASKPLYTLQFSCYHELKLPMYDPNGDKVKCRWARGEECDSVCHAVPSGHLDEDTCTLKFNATKHSNYTQDGWYAVALTMEDFPRNVIRIGNQTYNETMAMSTVPLQFLIHLVGKPSPCNWKPEFLSPTPTAGTTISVPAGKSFTQKIYAANLQNKNESITKLTLTRPAGMGLTGPNPDPARKGVYYWQLSWTPKATDKGDHIVCGMAEDSSGHTSDTRCFTLIAWDSPVDPCTSNPCRGNQTCTRIGSSQNIRCVCPQGFTLMGAYCNKITTPSITTPTTTTSTSTTTTTTTFSSTSSSTSPTTLKVASTGPTHKIFTPARTNNRAGNSTNSIVLGTSSTKNVLLTKNVNTRLPTNGTVSIGKQQTSNHQTLTVNNGPTTTANTGIRQTPTMERLGGRPSSGNCFGSKPVVVFTTFITILIVALAAIAGILVYKLRQMQKQLKLMDSSNDSFNIASDK